MLPDNVRPRWSTGVASRPAPAGSLAILLCTFNGTRFLRSQLASFDAQDFKDWRLFVSDDGSQDDTLRLLDDFQSRQGAPRVSIRRGPEKGFVANFLSLICDPAHDSEFYALSDQDDVWAPDKLSRARAWLTAAGDVPAVYCGRTRLIDEAGAEIGLSLSYRRTPHFRNALTQSLAGGNTMVLNEKARRLLMQAGPDVIAPSHDWWIYLAVTAIGGKMLYDREPTVSYRMHGHNVIGSNSSLLAQMQRARMMWRGRLKSWTEMNVAALERIESLMTADNRRTFDLFRQARRSTFLPRVAGLLRAGIYRQTLLGDMGLAAAVMLGKI